MADKQYRVVNGIVQFPPRDGDAGGKPVRNVTIRQTGFGHSAISVSATLWPSHAHVEVNEGDVVTVEGTYTQNKTQKQDGTPVTYHNLSVIKIKNFGPADTGADTPVENAVPAADEDDDEIPY